ncbi:hypothetical protein ACFSVN_08705 [Gracilimonas halophila]|uniref:Uncharacterized protein n=1 Tax=Gracilimonas halophila TaxID=1834464 RepID=A0ABW5JJB4_9BACT
MDDERWTDLRSGGTPKKRGEVFNKAKEADAYKYQINHSAISL